MFTFRHPFEAPSAKIDLQGSTGGHSPVPTMPTYEAAEGMQTLSARGGGGLYLGRDGKQAIKSPPTARDQAADVY